jgi:hypothetical protein
MQLMILADLALITFTLLLNAVLDSNTHTAIKECPELKRMGFYA